MTNFSLLTSQFLVPPAIDALCASPQSTIDGFLAAGHVCAVMGYQQYQPLAKQFKVPIVVTGFEPLDILQGVLLCIQQLEQGEARVENQYTRAVTSAGNLNAQQLLDEVFTVTRQSWRGIGEIADSGFSLNREFRPFDANYKFNLPQVQTDPKGDRPAGDCISGDIMQGWKKPSDCPQFGTSCRPDSPIGAPMVSSEGACAAYYRYASTHQTSQ